MILSYTNIKFRWIEFHVIIGAVAGSLKIEDESDSEIDWSFYACEYYNSHTNIFNDGPNILY